MSVCHLDTDGTTHQGDDRHLVYRGDTAKVYGLFTEAPPALNTAAEPLPPLDPMLAEAQ